MFRFLKRFSILIGLASSLSLTPQALGAKSDSIADFIKSNRRGTGIVINTPKYDQNAKVFFLIYLGYNTHQQDKLESVTKPLVPVHKKLAGSGAELVMYLDFPPEQKGSAAKNKKDKSRRNTNTEKRTLSIKCPVINVFHSDAREALFKKDARGKEQSYGTYDLRATDAKGIPLAYFSYENGEMIMRDAETGDKKSVGKGSYNGNEWVGPAILASYQELVDKVSTHKSTTETISDQADEEEKSQPAKKGKKKSAKKKKSK
jgi:hypothetical protein